jgi:glycosyltransferase involved in cell wall biosynthesis
MRPPSPLSRAGAPDDPARPWASMLLIAYEQQASIAEAIQGALAQTWSPLEIMISDDASSDGTFAAMQAAVAGYTGPHRVVLNRNPHNLGIGAHLSHLVKLSKGEMLFVAAGDDVSLPQRVERVMQAWLASNQRLDLIAAKLIDVDELGHTGAVITPSDLAEYRNAADWLARPPFVVGAAQAWTRRVFERFGPLPRGVVAEDLIMVLRALMSGGAVTLAEPLVRYRRGGLSFRRRALRAGDVVKALLKNNSNSLIELPLLLNDARSAGQQDALEPALLARLAREHFIRDLFAAGSLHGHFQAVGAARTVPLALRLRLFVYAACPALLAPFFWLKRSVHGPAR